MTTTTNNAAQLAQEQEQERKRSYYHIFRDVTRHTDDGQLLPLPWVRQWLHITPAGRYVWTDHDRATDIQFSDSCRIIDNLQAHGNGYRYNYGKIWQY